MQYRFHRKPAIFNKGEGGMGFFDFLKGKSKMDKVSPKPKNDAFSPKGAVDARRIKKPEPAVVEVKSPSVNKTPPGDETVTDVEGNVYHTVKIGNQLWTVENLRTTKYYDGTAISLVTDEDRWKNLATPAYCWYGNDINHKSKYGALYNWYAVDTKKLAPTGWHVPTDKEWTILEKYLIANGYNWDGTKRRNKIAKSLAAKTGWALSTNEGAIGNDVTKNNKSGFSALLGGSRPISGTFFGQSLYGHWWSATEGGAAIAFYRNLYCGFDYLYRRSNLKSCGFSVRLVRD